MIIAQSGEFRLNLKNYICDHDYMTHDIEICHYEEGCSYTIASFNDDGELVSCGDRLMDVITTIDNAAEDIKTLEEIGSRICATENILSGYGKMITIKCTLYNKDGTPGHTKIYKRPIEKDLEVWCGVKDFDCKEHYFYTKEQAAEYVAEIDNFEEIILRETSIENSYYVVKDSDIIGVIYKIEIE